MKCDVPWLKKRLNAARKATREEFMPEAKAFLREKPHAYALVGICVREALEGEEENSVKWSFTRPSSYFVPPSLAHKLAAAMEAEAGAIRKAYEEDNGGDE